MGEKYGQTKCTDFGSDGEFPATQFAGNGWSEEQVFLILEGPFQDSCRMYTAFSLFSLGLRELALELKSESWAGLRIHAVWPGPGPMIVSMAGELMSPIENHTKSSPLSALLLSDCQSMSSSSSKKKRNLPSWMSSREEQEKEEEEDAVRKEPQSTHNFSKLMEGVVFVLSGFVNPERAQLRSWALEMGAQFQTDWNPSCTLLVCAFRNTPKFHQVQADSGTIVSKEWISECYNQRKLVDIEPFLLHAGKPWRQTLQNVSSEPSQDHKVSSTLKSQKQAEKSSKSQPSSCASSEGKPSNPVSDSFSPSRVKKWATDDLGKTLSWLESQDEKPEQSEIKKIAAEGILTCLQDTIDTLEQGQHIQQISEQWACIPRVVEELIKMDSAKGVSKEVLCKDAVACNQIYKAEYSHVADEASVKAEKKMKPDKRGKKVVEDGGTYDSDETVEMTEEEIEQAYNTVSSSILEFN